MIVSSSCKAEKIGQSSNCHSNLYLNLSGATISLGLIPNLARGVRESLEKNLGSKHGKTPRFFSMKGNYDDSAQK